MTRVRIGLIGDYNPGVTAHQAIPRALAGEALGCEVEPVWLSTASLGPPPARSLDDFDGLWCVPASPYVNTGGAIAAIGHARSSGTPFLGTCGGFQHALLEYAAACWPDVPAIHAELDPSAVEPVIWPLACALVEQQGHVRLAPGSLIAAAYGGLEADEGYHCRYGLNPRYADRLAADAPLRATAWDPAGEIRAVELEPGAHPFFVATLFQPERAALRGVVPPLARALVRAAMARARARSASA